MIDATIVHRRCVISRGGLTMWPGYGIAALLLAAVVACATVPTSIAPGDVMELCFDAAVGDTIVYRFEGSGPLAFNLHYHDGEQTYYPVPEHETKAEKGQFLARADQTYCLMWTNNRTKRVAIEASVEGARQVRFH